MNRVVILYEHDELAQKERQTLKEGGDEVLLLKAGDMTLSQVREFSPDVILLEVSLNGELSSLRERLLGDPELRELPLIALTEDESLGRSILAQAYLSPSAPPEELRAIVDELASTRVQFS